MTNSGQLAVGGSEIRPLGAEVQKSYPKIYELRPVGAQITELPHGRWFPWRVLGFTGGLCMTEK